jgi:sugar transferase (PEP-CTERM system associated)
MIRLFKVFVPTSVIALLVCEVVLVFVSYLAAAYWVMGPEIDTFLWVDYGLPRLSIVAALIIIGLYFHDRYTNLRVQNRTVLLQQLCLITGVAFIAQAIIAYIHRDWMLPRWLMIEGSMLAAATILVSRLLFSSAITKALGADRILFLGSSPIVFEVANHLTEHPELGLMPVGYLAEECGAPELSERLARVGCLNDLMKVVTDLNPSRIAVGMQERRQRLPVQELLDLRFSGVQTEEIANVYEVMFGRVCTREIRPAQMIFSHTMGPRKHNLRLQSIYSIGLSVCALVMFLPVMIAVAVLVKLTSPGPVLIRQKRVGINGKTFTVYKFRSMYQDAEARTGAVWAKRNDPRITPLGHWLRKLRLDELPQLFNVVKGDMSIVGPRPERPEFVNILSEQIPYYRQRHCVMPGITGWAQINYKYGDTIEDTMMKLEYDLYYIKHISPSLDFLIMFHTAKTMLLFRGAQ